MKMFDPLLETARTQLNDLRDVRLVQVTVLHPADDPQVAHLRLRDLPNDVDQTNLERLIAQDRELAAAALPGASSELLDYYQNVLNGSVIHELSVLRALGISPPSEWQAQALTPLGESEPATLLATGLKDDSALILSWNWLPEHPEYGETISVLASNGRLALEMAKPYLLEERSSLEVETFSGEIRETSRFVAGHDTGFLRQLDAFKAAIKTGNVPVAGLADARADIFELQKIARALGAAQGQNIRIEAAE